MNRWWANDPDALMIRRNERMERGLRLTYGLLNEEEVKTSVINQKGVVLPSTGGIGTTIFYVIGGILVVGAVVLLIVRRRMRNEEE